MLDGALNTLDTLLHCLLTFYFSKGNVTVAKLLLENTSGRKLLVENTCEAIFFCRKLENRKQKTYSMDIHNKRRTSRRDFHVQKQPPEVFCKKRLS